MKVVILDAATLGLPESELARLTAFGELTVHEITAPEQTRERVADAEIAVTNKVVLDREVIAASDRLRLIGISATGVNNVDLAAAKERGIIVCNVSGYSTPSVTQHTLALLLSLATNVHRYAEEAEEWPKSPIFTRLTHPVCELEGRTLGIAGAGAIGTAVGVVAEALGMSIQVLGREGRMEATAQGWPRLAREDFFRTSDAITLHCPLTDATYHLINAETLALMPPGSFLINTGRGDLVDETALAAALRAGRLGGAALDVLSREPPPADHPLLAPDLANLMITPHSAWISRESRQRLWDAVVANVGAFLEGAPSNQVA